MSVLEVLLRIRRHRSRAAEFRALAEASVSPDVRSRNLAIAEHYGALADAEERSERAKVIERLESLKADRQRMAGGSIC